MAAVRPEQIAQILQLTDSLKIHREAVQIPLGTQEQGSAAILPDGHLRIVCPSAGSFDDWLKDLRAQLEKMDLSKVTQHS